jgi:3'-5' exoribonuclease
VEKVYVKDVHDKQQVKSIFMVAKKTATSSKAGKPFLAITLRDRTGDLDARIWENTEEQDAKFDKGDLVQVEGQATTFQGRVQLKIDSIEKVSPEGIDLGEFTPPAKAPGERAFQQIGEMVDRLQDPHLKALLRSFLDDESFAADFKRAPAAKSVHHSHPGGLAEHTASVMRLAQRVGDLYPQADRELMIAGAFLHDIGKPREMSSERGTEYTDEGRLVGHLVIAAELIHERCAKIEGFPRALEMHLTHIVLSHHGSHEFGSPRLPQTLEAMIVHHLDEMDSRVGSWLEIMQRDPGEKWTDFQKLYGRHLYKGPSPTIHGKAPVERRRKRARGEKAERPERQEKPAAAEKPEARAAAPAAAAPAKPEGAMEREKRERPPKESKEKLTFKPFAALTPVAPPEEKPEEKPEKETAVPTEPSSAPAVEQAPTEASSAKERPAELAPSESAPAGEALPSAEPPSIAGKEE